MKKLKKPISDQKKKELLRKRCVGVAKKIAGIRDGYKCRYCGVGRPQRMTHEHHIFHEGMSKAMSADPDNLITLCATHHQGGMWMKSNSGFNFHNSPAESTIWLEENLPHYQELKSRSRETKPLDIFYWQSKLEELNELLKVLN